MICFVSVSPPKIYSSPCHVIEQLNDTSVFSPNVNEKSSSSLPFSSMTTALFEKSFLYKISTDLRGKADVVVLFGVVVPLGVVFVMIFAVVVVAKVVVDSAGHVFLFSP